MLMPTTYLAVHEQVDLTPDKLTPAKRQKAGDDNEDEVENDEGEDGQVLGYPTV
jgi:hypothetical protein